MQKTKKTLEKFKARENQIIQSFTNVFDDDTSVVRITRDQLDAGKRVLSITDCVGKSPNDSKIVLTQDLSHLESKMPVNEKAKSYPGDAENSEPELPKERSIYGVIKVFLANLENCTVVVKCKIITGTLELHNCTNVVVRIEKEATVATIQADLSENITIEFHDAVSGKHVPGQQKAIMYWGEDKDDRIFHAGMKHLQVKLFRDDYLETSITSDYLTDGAEQIGNATPEEFQFVTSVHDGTLVTEKVVRTGTATGSNVRAMTDRELAAEKEKREKAAKMAIQMAEDMVQIKDKNGNILVKKESSVETVVEEDDAIEEINTPGIQADKDVVAECEQLKTRGNEAFGAGEYGQAILHYSLCLDKSEELTDKSGFPRDIVYSNRAAAFLKLGQHDKAESDASSALEINPANVKASFRRGLALHADGKYEQALPVLVAAHKAEPKNKQIKQALQFCEVRLAQEQRKRMQQ